MAEVTQMAEVAQMAEVTQMVASLRHVKMESITT